MGKPRPDMCISMTSTRSKVKVKELLTLTRSKVTILACSSKMMVDRDNMGPSLQLVRAQFSNFLLRNLSHEFKLCGMSILHEFQMAIFPYCLRLQSHGQACWQSYMYCACWYDLDLIKGHGHNDLDLIKGHGHWPSEVPKIALFYVYFLRHFGMQLKSDGWLW